MKMCGWIPTVVSLSLACGQPLAAQYRMPRLESPSASVLLPVDHPTVAVLAPTYSAKPNPTALATNGILLGAVGALAGGYLGGQLTDSFEGALIGATVFESALLPLGVHIANDSRGRYPVALLVSGSVGAAGLGYVFSRYTDESLVTASIAVPVIQLAFSIAEEMGALK